jgi:hypothetical protein
VNLAGPGTDNLYADPEVNSPAATLSADDGELTHRGTVGTFPKITGRRPAGGLTVAAPTHSRAEYGEAFDAA